jgi:hypothetical protein
VCTVDVGKEYSLVKKRDEERREVENFKSYPMPNL